VSTLIAEVISDQSQSDRSSETFSQSHRSFLGGTYVYHTAPLVLQNVQLEDQRNALPLMHNAMIPLNDAMWFQ